MEIAQNSIVILLKMMEKSSKFSAIEKNLAYIFGFNNVSAVFTDSYIAA